MEKTRVKSGVSGNPTASDSSGDQRRILETESDALTGRLTEVIGENVSEFGRRCGVKESTLRNIRNGAVPRADTMVAIARAGNVTVDWLATGRQPKTRAEQRAASYEVAPVAAVKTEGEGPGQAINAEALSAILGGILQAMGPGQDYAKAAAMAIECYQKALKEELIKPKGIGSGDGQNSA